MPFSTVAQIRATDQRLNDAAEVPDPDITSRITDADKEIITDLSGIATEADLLALGAASHPLNLLSMWKTTEIILAKYFGASRKVDEVSDIQYWQRKYAKLLKAILDGDVALISETVDVTPINIPVITGSAHTLKIYPRKGIEGFVNDGAESDYQDDEFK